MGKIPRKNMDDVKLIKLVEDNPVLYNAKHTRYMDVNYKTVIWNNISQAMGRTEKECKSRWQAMRDAYRKSLHKQYLALAGKEKFYSKYRYARQMQFLRNHFQTLNDTLMTINDGDGNEMEEIKLEVGYDIFGDESESSRSPVSADPIGNYFENSEEIEVEINKMENIDLQPAQSTSSASTTNKIDPIKAFLNSVETTLKNLTPYYLNLAKTEIFATVQKYELKMLTEENKNP